MLANGSMFEVWDLRSVVWVLGLGFRDWCLGCGVLGLSWGLGFCTVTSEVRLEMEMCDIDERCVRRKMLADIHMRNTFKRESFEEA
jgi:hypothetical protein